MPFSQKPENAETEELFQQLVREYYPSIQRYFQYWRCTPEESQDLTQETFLNAFRGLPSFRREAKPGTWLVEVAKHVLYNSLRHKSAQRRHGQEVALDDSESGAEAEASGRGETDDILEELLRKEQGALLIREICKLPPQMQRCMLLRAQGFEYQGIATAMGISIQTVRSQLHEGKKRLKISLEVQLSD